MYIYILRKVDRFRQYFFPPNHLSVTMATLNEKKDVDGHDSLVKVVDHIEVADPVDSEPLWHYIKRNRRSVGWSVFILS